MAKVYQKGVVIVQFALTCAFFLFFTIAIFDVCRLIAFQAILNYAADNGLNLAAKIANFDNDIRGLSPADPDYLLYADSRRRITDEAVRFPLTTLLTDHFTASGGKLLSYTVSDNSLSLPPGVSPPIFSADALVIRPGESATTTDGTTTVVVTHPTLLPGPGGTPPNRAPKLLLAVHPIVVELRTLVQLQSPFVPDIVLVGRAHGFREDVPSGPFGTNGAGPEGVVVTVTPTTTTTTTRTSTSSTTTTTWGCVIDWEVSIKDTWDDPMTVFCPQDVAGSDGICTPGDCPNGGI